MLLFPSSSPLLISHRFFSGATLDYKAALFNQLLHAGSDLQRRGQQEIDILQATCWRRHVGRSHQALLASVLHEDTELQLRGQTFGGVLQETR